VLEQFNRFVKLDIKVECQKCYERYSMNVLNRVYESSDNDRSIGNEMRLISFRTMAKAIYAHN